MIIEYIEGNSYDVINYEINISKLIYLKEMKRLIEYLLKKSKLPY